MATRDGAARALCSWPSILCPPTVTSSSCGEHVAAVAPGSYGLLHDRDDEEQGHENDVRVLKLVRGMVTHTRRRYCPRTSRR
ncbi:Imm7 family immunity protein [Streptomyces sp. NPDC057287]|uniref:Imm7 family immunity protein n=1 Tax=Streptomyces sp. NPDC057287 TaxID=3346086 RepID=UPI0036320ED2